MKSMRLGGVAGNVKLKGKLERLLSCKCCVLVNLKRGELIKQQKREIFDFLRGKSEDSS